MTLGPRGVTEAQQGCSLCRACSVQSVSGYSIWETWPRQLAWHTTVLDIPAGSDTSPLSGSCGTQAPWLRTAAPSVSNCQCLSTGGDPPLLKDPQSHGFGRAPFCCSNLSQAAATCLRRGFIILKCRHPIQQAFPCPTCLGRIELPSASAVGKKATMNGLNTGGISALNTEIAGF